MIRRFASVIVLVGAVIASTGSARAEDEWAKGVAPDAQHQANALFAEGNELFAKQAHAPALEKYKAAIALWDHPLIRFNMAVTEVRLDRILDAAADLERALRYGDKPFSHELYQQALDYQALIGKQVGEVCASCDQAETRVILDGKAWFTCAGTHSERVLAGEHVLVGERKGYITQSLRFVVRGGVTTTQKVALVPLETAVKWKYRYPRWLPYAVAGGGTAIGVGGIALWFAGRNQMNKFESDFAKQCPNGCKSDLSDVPALADERDSAKLKGKIAVGMMIGGGAVTVTGVVLAVLNSHPQRILPRLEVTPTAGGAITSTWWRF